MPELITLASIIVPPGRDRQTFDEDAIDALAESILANTLINPITVEHIPSGALLLAGERRLRAVQKLAKKNLTFMCGGLECYPGTIAAVTLKELSEGRRRSIEYAENADRVDLPWQEAVEAWSRLHELLKSENPKQTPTATARQVYGPSFLPSSSQAAKVLDAVRIAPHLSDPEVAKAKTTKEAVRIIERKTVNLFHEALAKKVAAGEMPQSHHRYYNLPAETLFPTLATNSVDIIITDPPYGVDANTWDTLSESESGHVHDYDDTFDEGEGIVKLLAVEGARVCKPNAHLYMFCEHSYFHLWLRIFAAEGWFVWPDPIIWNKCGIGMLKGNANGPRHTYECILFAQRGGRKVRSVLADVISIPGPQSKLHPAEKPVEVYIDLLSRSAIPGDVVFDPYMGSGPIFPACNHLNLRALGNEKAPTHYATAVSRLNEFPSTVSKAPISVSVDDEALL